MDRRHFLVGLGAGVTATAVASSLRVAHTPKRPRHIFFFADSFSGFSLGIKVHEVPDHEPLYVFSAPHRTINKLAEDNDSPIRCINVGMSGYVTSGACLSTVIAAVSYSITADDWIVVSDAGAHGSDPDAFQAAAEAALHAFKAAGAPVYAMTMFDYPDGSLGARAMYQWSRVFGGRTINQALIAAASAVGGISVINMKSVIDNWRTTSLANTGVDPMRLADGTLDGVHPGIWGQTMYVGEILRTLGLGPAFPSKGGLKAIAAANFARLSAGSRSWNATLAQNYVDICLAA